jgi:hypothetical protein
MLFVVFQNTERKAKQDMAERQGHNWLGKARLKTQPSHLSFFRLEPILTPNSIMGIRHQFWVGRRYRISILKNNSLITERLELCQIMEKVHKEEGYWQVSDDGLEAKMIWFQPWLKASGSLSSGTGADKPC